MINVVTQFGSSFKGLAAYLLHDVDQADTSERVAWTETHGLATDDPERGWRIMAATAMSQAQLKAEAGVANTGRKSPNHVMHYVLSWHPDERETLNRDEMIAAAKASMTYLGTYEGEKLGKGKQAKRTQHADEHQAVIVCHDEGPGSAPHLHVMLNRVHPEHGVMLPDSKDYEKLSAWALDYRTAQGNEHYCPERTKTAAKKAQGIVSSNPRKPRNVYEQEQAIAAADPGSRKKALLEQHQRRARELKTRTEAMKQRHAKAVLSLETRHVAAERAERTRTAEAIQIKTAAIRAAYAPKIDALTERQVDEKEAFKEAKGTAAGHVRNTWAAFKTKQWMSEIRTNPLEAMKHSFTLAFSSGLQQRDIEKHHQREQGELRGARHREDEEARRKVRMDEGFRLDDLRQKYYQQRNDLMLRQDMEKAKLKAEWHQLEQDRLAVAAEDARSRKIAMAQEQQARRDEDMKAGQQEKERRSKAVALPIQDRNQADDRASDPNPSAPSPEKHSAEIKPDTGDATPLKPRFDQAATQPPSATAPPADDEKARKYRAFLDSINRQSDHTRSRDQDRHRE